MLAKAIDLINFKSYGLSFRKNILAKAIDLIILELSWLSLGIPFPLFQCCFKIEM